MLLARYAPIDSKRYEKLAQAAKSIDQIIEWLPTQLFGIWTIFVAGMAIGKAQSDRYYFWDWSDWLIGILGLLVITIIYSPLKKKLKIKEIPKIKFHKYTASNSFYFITYIILFSIGWIITSALDINNFVYFYSSYLAYFVAIIFVNSIKYEDTKIIDRKHKNIQTIVAIFALLFCIFFGFVTDDPVLSTASIVSLPFLVVLLFGKHIRHLERAKFYPIFIFAMFVVSREAWFLIPLLLLFFMLRSYNYLRYQKVYPTFGVTDDQN